jgi:methylated-DNA-protein-cysteine methyltransferase-like protein
MGTMPSEFSTQVIKLIKKIPRGRVATYGQIAALAGKPHAARGVSWILSSSSEAHKLPWHRVLNSKGQIAFRWGTRGYLRQKNALEREGIDIVDRVQVDLGEYQWKTSAKTSRSKAKSSHFKSIFLQKRRK